MLRRSPTQNGMARSAAAAQTRARAGRKPIPAAPAIDRAPGSVATVAPMTMAVTAATSTIRARTIRRTRPARPWRLGEAPSCSSQLPYSETTVWTRPGSLRSTHAAAGAEPRMSHGVVSVVAAETATASG